MLRPRSPRDRIHARAQHWLHVVSLGATACGSPPATTPPPPMLPLETRPYQVSDPVADPMPAVTCRSAHAPTTARFVREGDGYELLVAISGLPDELQIVSATVSPDAEARIERAPGAATLRVRVQRIENRATIRVTSSCLGLEWQVDIAVTWTDPEVIANSELPVVLRDVGP